MRRVRFAAAIAIAVWMTGAMAARAEAGALLRRKVAGDEPIVPPAVAGGHGGVQCPEKLRHVPLGSEIQVWLAPQMARRDDPGWSLILRLAQKRAYLLYHHDRTFSELRYPVKERELWSGFHAQIAEAGEGKLLELQASTAVATTQPTVDGKTVHERRLTVVDGFDHRRDVEVQLLASPELGRVAFELEVLHQRIRTDGVAWLPLTGSGDGVPLALGEVQYGPDLPFHQREEYLGFQEQEVPAARFTVPEGYGEVRYTPECLRGS